MKNILKNKKMMVALAALVIVAVVFIVIRKRKKSSETADGGAASQPGGGSSALPMATFPLTPYSQAGEYSAAKGSYGQQIADLQRLCNSKHGTNLDVDGKYGPKTDEAFQSKLGTLLFSCRISESQYNIFMNQ